MQTPQVVVFDLGKVLVDFDYSRAARALAAESGLSAADVQALIDHTPLLKRYETAEITSQQFFEEFQRHCSYRAAYEVFRRAFADIFSEIPEMVRLQQHLQQSGVPTWIFSNTNEIAINHIREQFPFFRNFDGYVLSYEHRAMKPDPALYEVVERNTQRSGSEIIYLDDREENIETARGRDWQVIWHQSIPASLETLRQAGLPIPAR